MSQDASSSCENRLTRSFSNLTASRTATDTDGKQSSMWIPSTEDTRDWAEFRRDGVESLFRLGAGVEEDGGRWHGTT